MLSTIEKVLFLKSMDLFAELHGEDLAKVARIAEEVFFEAGEYIMREGETGDCLYLVTEGQVLVLSGDQELACLDAGECVGEMSLLDSEPRSASVMARTEAALLRIGQEDFYSMMTEKPEIAHSMVKLLTGRLRKANYTIGQLTEREGRHGPQSRLPENSGEA